ncbi:MAG: hypothetical protein H6746_04145 [Deltaproteobacteria bacterium]|nr:hypothetical protein [Deltaproteobacteria bacterium]
MGIGRRLFVLRAALVIGCLGVGLSAPARADGGGTATFDVTVIQASKSDGAADPALGKLLAYLQKSFSGYKSFKRLDARTLTVAQDGSATMPLPGGKQLELSYLGAAKGFVRVHLTVDGLKTTVNVKDGGLFFQAGRVLDGGIMVLAIGAQTGG